ncbi:CRM-domain containing factor CFM3, chloroplastic/mitochondrial isoform X1 [Ricinus communis]|uniref:CRM-domain containing factor CFM3, chloroplastic/mitochondrial isoform X1 n=1 Tax=Ricinus communis TaxID=3988 RepID=UPI00201AB4B8|nr:CRM-domain containing factor CFM3, chloroplastic/mitochondrial isoform X1 [Ricinus communis]
MGLLLNAAIIASHAQGLKTLLLLLAVAMDMALTLSTSSSSSRYPLFLQARSHSPFKAFNFETNCSYSRSIQVSATKTKRKPRPSFFEQIRDKWSLKVPSTRDTFPWQEPEQQQEHQGQGKNDEEEIERCEISGVTLSKAEIDANPSSIDDDSVSVSLPNHLTTAPWVHGTRPKKNHFSSRPKIGENVVQNDVHTVVDIVENLEKEVTCNDKFKKEDNILHVDNAERLVKEVNYDKKFKEAKVQVGGFSVELKRDNEIARAKYSKSPSYINEKPFGANGGYGVQVSYDDNSSSIELPWEKERVMESVEGYLRGKRSNTELAERMLPEHELKRLRNVALRMYERIKVGAAGINQDLVDAVHEKWRLDEVVKLKFEEPLSFNMRRTHEILENRTGGLVIWRSGSSVVLYRGISYKLHCVRSFSKQDEAGKEILAHPEEVTSNATLNIGVKHFIGTTESYIPDRAKYLKDLSREELTDFTELNQFLDELGPRFEDWCGREPLPVDADLLLAVDPGYKPPFRLLPYGVRHCLTDKEMTIFRRLARTVPPHFALGRNRQLQGLAKAIVKLWERSAIVKIAIKRGVQNTRNERMAEELKVLTGGILLSRNKEYIVFYRGNDFLPPAIVKTLKERKKLTYLKQDEEEQARQMALASVESSAKTSKVPLVAGTLAETVAATSHWRDQRGSPDIDEMLREAVLAKRASLVKHLENKLALAKGKLRKAEKALAKVHEHLDPSGLPTDLETISDEERFLFRKIGLSMKPYLFLGKRGVYDGTIENMHLHWKYRELVKVIVRGKSFAQVKHIAISLEAESGGVLVSIERTTKGYAIIVYRGKNYLHPEVMRPKNLLTKRQALVRSIELQRREALKHHISDLQERIELLKLELEDMESGKEIDVDKMSSRLDDSSISDSDVEEGGEEAYLVSTRIPITRTRT